MKIFLTVGSQLPMDRLVESVENTIVNNSGIDCCAQIGDSKLDLKKINAFSILPEQEFIQHAKNADLIISHAGMGNILLAQELHKPIMLLARKSILNESVNDHQLGTIQGLSERYFIFSMKSERDVEKGLDWFRSWKPKKANIPERERLISALRDYISS